MPRKKKENPPVPADGSAVAREPITLSARNAKVEANLALVVSIARKFTGRGLELDDLIGEGNLGLIDAAERFDPSYGTKFSTYAAYWIKEKIRRAFKETTATIRVPSHLSRTVTAWRRAEQAIIVSTGRHPDPDDVSDFLGLNPVQRKLVAHAILTGRLRPGSRQAQYGNPKPWSADGCLARMDTPYDPPDRLDRVMARMAKLDARQRQAVEQRFGLAGCEPATLQQIGDRLGLTKEWVRQIIRDALRTLGYPDDPRTIRYRASRAKKDSALAASYAQG